MKYYTVQFNGDFEDFEEHYNGKPFPLKINGSGFRRGSARESLDIKTGRLLNEFEDPTDNEGPVQPSEIDYDKLYTDLFNQLSSAMSDCIGPRENWLCFKRIEDEMKFLKESADKEINAKIDLVCKTGGNSHSLLKYPFKAEGLKGMWARYSSELQQRINNRIAQLKGSSGGVETGSAAMVEDFLRVTYPQIIAMMITYRCVFEQLKEVYKDGFTPKVTMEDIKSVGRQTRNN